MFYTSLCTELRRQGAESAVAIASKALITQIIPKLRPAMVRETVRTEHPYWAANKRYDLQHFQERVTESAKYSCKRFRDDQVQASAPQGASGTRNGSQSKRKRGPHCDPKAKTAQLGGKVKGKNTSKKDMVKQRTHKKWREQEWNTPCFNLEFPEIHPLKHCQNTSRREKDELFAKLRSERRSISALTEAKYLKLTDGLWKAIAEAKLDATTLGDIGADWSAIPRRIIEDLKREGIYVAQPN